MKTYIFQWIYRHIYTRTSRVMYIHTYIYKHIYKYMCVQKCTELCSILGSCMWKSLSTSKNASNTLPMEAISSYAHTCIYASCSCAFPKIRSKIRTFEYVISRLHLFMLRKIGSQSHVSTRHDFERHLFLVISSHENIWLSRHVVLCRCLEFPRCLVEH
jgi:hypothetical protein